MQKFLSHYFTTTYRKKPLVVGGTTFARGAHIHAIYGGTIVFSLWSWLLSLTSIEQREISNKTCSLTIEYRWA